MIITGKEIRLRQIDNNDLETLRHWRNHPSIQRHMFYREHITKEMQVAWFERINNPSNLYLIIEHKGEGIGLIHLSEIQDKEAQAGLFLAKPEYVGHYIPVLASLILLHLAFNHYHLNRVKARVLPDNDIAIQYNKRLGFLPTEHPEWMVVDSHQYKLVTRKLSLKIPNKLRHYKIEKTPTPLAFTI